METVRYKTTRSAGGSDLVTCNKSARGCSTTTTEHILKRPFQHTRFRNMPAQHGYFAPQTANALTRQAAAKPRLAASTHASILPAARSLLPPQRNEQLAAPPARIL
jgi:hypothetical protein